ncbi:MAG TPA: heparan-alpha-glucosaminide N-acetyltransferase domain-containing protein [Holophagaceae bacterium]|nr:heparan-alpha-glucosaminide N-acetyltransferase domain-containing protein [Holophagaceae bacterium]
MSSPLWEDRTPAQRCDWVDQLRGWAILVMIEVHCVNVWLKLGLRPGWLNYLNGLVAPSFLMAAGFSLVLSTFRTDGTLRPFKDSFRRYLFILVCAYALHAPGFSLAEWTVLATPWKWRELFKIDVLQCIVFSLLILQGLARVLRRPRGFAFVALALAIYIPLVSPYLWAQGMADGLWLPIRGLLNGNPDRGVQALFPLFPWLGFVAFGAFLGGIYRWTRVEKDAEGRSLWSEGRYLALLAGAGLLLWGWGHWQKETWLWGGQWRQMPGGQWLLFSRWGAWNWNELQTIHNTTLPSVAERLGWICLGGAAMGFTEAWRPRWKGENWLASASRESLLIYMLHLNLIFGALLSQPVLAVTGLDWNTQGWAVTLLMTALVVGGTLAFGLWWQRVRKDPGRMRQFQFAGLSALAIWFLVGGWWTFRYYLQSPELAREPYVFLPAARARKQLPPTPDGLCRDPEEYFREADRRAVHLTDEARVKIREQIQRRSR